MSCCSVISLFEFIVRLRTSCIVGPNGSGKSNVIDALLFVFGYRAQKIRSKKVSVLIHKSDQYPDLESCSVTVRFATIKDELFAELYTKERNLLFECILSVVLLGKLWGF
ncbi:structural maintenance of chromosomes protein 4 [Caerostris extrusa]|uniref:Structural maintenance of chromosomes protein 4 n=1 Tax=Caerostris extrusa TaxID=172846 RepID=A0AAV4YG85_CAEEX|nr:structural maintenance of chromosomes protein 4 [Caerostris extrusa]